MKKLGEVIRAHSPELDGQALADRVRASLEVTNVQLSKLFVSRIHRIAARVKDPDLRDELYELANDVEERMSR